MSIFSLLAGEQKKALPENLQRMAELGLRNSRRLLALIDDLLDIQKLSMDKIDFHLEILDLRDVVVDAVELNEPIGQARGIAFEVTTGPAPLVIEGDRSRLVQVMTNLLSNAVKFTKSGDVIEISVDSKAGKGRVSVVDHGPGIPREARDNVFEKFTQADASLTRKHGGTGLGLAIARSIVERLHGRIYFETKIDEGTVFHVELPLIASKIDAQ